MSQSLDGSQTRNDFAWESDGRATSITLAQMRSTGKESAPCNESPLKAFVASQTFVRSWQNGVIEVFCGPSRLKNIELAGVLTEGAFWSRRDALRATEGCAWRRWRVPARLQRLWSTVRSL